MNSLSWLIYLADVSDSLDWYLDTTFILALVVGIVCGIAGAIMAAEEDDPPQPEHWKAWRRITSWTLAALAFATLAGAAVPSKETLYAIAASEVGEDIVKSDTANKALNGINAWLDKQIEGEKSTEKKEKNDGE